ncbi:Uncharacterised protein g9329 [Pycnogonum litorale]
MPTIPHLVLVAFASFSLVDGHPVIRPPRCLRIAKTDLGCETSLPYRETRLPNIFGDKTLTDATSGMKMYRYFTDSQCSKDFSTFICSVYLPMCREYGSKIVLPCKSLCLSVRRSCDPLAYNAGFQFPYALDCKNFPDEKDGGSLCVGHRGILVNSKSKSKSTSERRDDDDGSLTNLKHLIHKYTLSRLQSKKNASIEAVVVFV